MERTKLGKWFEIIALIAMCALTTRIAFPNIFEAKAETVEEETEAEIVLCKTEPIVIETEARPKVATVSQVTTIATQSEAKETEAEKHKQTYTEEDFYYMTCVLTGECQCYGREHQVTVGSVVLNRKNSPNWKGNTIKEICLARDGGFIQYACFVDGNAYRQQTELSKEVAKFLLENGSQIPSNVVYQSQSIQGHGVWKKLDCHYFCYE